MLLARAAARPRRGHGPRTADASKTAEVTARVETPRVESARLDPVKPEAKPARVEGALELRRSTD
jgi:hypothetical protein